MRSQLILAMLFMSMMPILRGAAVEPPSTAAQRVDAALAEEARNRGVSLPGICHDEDFLRRVTLDLVGRIPTSQELMSFQLDSQPDKRARVIDELVKSEDFAQHWSRYFRDVIYSRATDQRARLGQPTFQKWMADQIRQDVPWSKIATELVTATGDIRENGATALMAVHAGDANEVAAEVSRIFLGVQLQCANCHDHPSDQWKREQFHEFAAFFPRVTFRNSSKASDGERSFEVSSFGDDGRERRKENLKDSADLFFPRMDRNRDGRLTLAEVKAAPRGGGPLKNAFPRLLEVGDSNKDQALSLSEIKAMPAPPQMPGRGELEHYMEDLQNPSSKGTLIQPKFFLDPKKIATGLSDEERRMAAARAITSGKNVWFGRAITNRVWHEMLGAGFYMPVDDLGPSRSPEAEQALVILSEGFRANHDSLRWLFQTVARTEAYQRSLQAEATSTGESLAIANQMPARLRGDSIYGALIQVIGNPEERGPMAGRDNAPRRALRSPRNQFEQLFGMDPSTPQDEQIGNVPQALFLMNSLVLAGPMSARGNTRLGTLLRSFPKDSDAVAELYLTVLSREPSDQEMRTSLAHIGSARSRSEGFEDLLWALVNSTEFLSRR